MMATRFVSEKKTSIENNLEESETSPLSPNKLNCKKKRRSSFKSPVATKQIKTDPEIKNLSKKRDKPEDDSVEKKENILRRSKRRKNCDSNTQPGETAPTDIKNDANGIEIESLQNCSINVVPENVIKILDKELFPEEAEEEQNLNANCTEALVEDKQLVISAKEKCEPVATKVDNTVLVCMEVDYDTKTERNFLEMHNEITADNKKEINVTKEKTEHNNTRDVLSQELSQSLEANEKYKINIKTKSITNKNGTNDSSLDLLEIDIDKADDIISSLVTPVDKENRCSIIGHTIQNSKFHLSQNNCINGSFYKEQDKSFADINATENHDTPRKSSFQSKPLALSKTSKIILDDQLQRSLENMSYIENEQSEKQDEILNCSNDEIKDDDNEAKYNSLNSRETNYLDDNTLICEKLTDITKTLHTQDSSEEFNNQISSKNNANVFPVANGNFRENCDHNNSQGSHIQKQNSYTEINDSKDNTDKIKHPEENLEMKRKKLTLLYMSALDYAKETEENGFETMKKNSEIGGESFHSDAGDESTDNDIFVIQKDFEMPKLSLYDHSDAGDESTNNDIFVTQKDIEMPKLSPKEIDEQSTETIQELCIHQNISESQTSNEKVLEDTQDNSKEKQKNKLDLKIANQIRSDTTNNEQYDSNDPSPIECDLICCKEANKKHNFQEHFITLQFNDNISLSQTSNNVLDKNHEVNFNAENEETKKCYTNKCIYEADTTFTETAAECFKREQNANSKEMANGRKDENLRNSNEDKISNEDIDTSFDMDDDFNLTASQMNMLEVDENNQYKESKPGMNTGNCSNTHFGQDSITVEIIDQLCYIRESVDSIKELLKAFMTKNNGKE